MNYAPFNPAYGSGQSVTSGASAQVSVPAQSKNLALTNLGGTVVYIKAGEGVFTASAVDYPVPPGLQVVITKADGHDKLAVFGTGSALHIMAGEGF